MSLEIALTFSTPLLCLLLWASFPRGGKMVASSPAHILPSQQPQQKEQNSSGAEQISGIGPQCLCLFGVMCPSLNHPILPREAMLSCPALGLGMESVLPKLHRWEEGNLRKIWVLPSQKGGLKPGQAIITDVFYRPPYPIPTPHIL